MGAFVGTLSLLLLFDISKVTWLDRDLLTQLWRIANKLNSKFEIIGMISRVLKPRNACFRSISFSEALALHMHL